MKCYSYIRFSSKAQRAGKSLERQVETARKYAKEKNWEMDESLCMYDLGLSGFHAVHKNKGALGVFLEAIKENKIPTPSALIVENLDRLSREAVPDALSEFLSIIKAGITIVTLMDKQLYDQTSLKDEPYQLFGSIMIMARSHEESKTKQERRKYTWDKSKKEAREKGLKIKASCVSWLKLNEKTNAFEEIPEHVESVRRIYELYIQGHGVQKICKILNQEGRRTFSEHDNGWSGGTINYLLTKKVVLGEIQFRKTKEMVAGKRIIIEDGKAVKDYYPAIIDEDTFYTAQEIRKSKGGSFGKIGKMNNIFSLKAKCGYCGGSMNYGTRGKHKLEYLYCMKAKQGICGINQMFSLRYDHLQEAFLNTCSRLELTDIVNDGEKIQSTIKKLQAQINTINSKIQESKDSIEKFTEAMRQGSNEMIAYFSQLINEEFQKQKELKNTHTQLKEELIAQENLQGSTEVNLETLKAVIKQMNSTDEGTRLDVRRKLQKAIRLLIEEIKVFPVGPHYKQLVEEDEVFAEKYDIEKMGASNHSRLFSKFRTVEITFKGGGSLLLVNDESSGGMKLHYETDKSGILTQETIDTLRNNPNIIPEMIEVVKKAKI